MRTKLVDEKIRVINKITTIRGLFNDPNNWKKLFDQNEEQFSHYYLNLILIQMWVGASGDRLLEEPRNLIERGFPPGL